MKLNDIKTKELLPDFVINKNWVCNSLDTIIKSIAERRKAIPAPFGLDSIQAMSDEELEYYFNLISPIPYDPTLSRVYRNILFYDLVNINDEYGNPLNTGYISSLLYSAFGARASVGLNDIFNLEENGNYTSFVDENDKYLYNVTVSLNDYWTEDDEKKLFIYLDNLARATCKYKELEYSFRADIIPKCGGINLNDSNCLYSVYIDLGNVIEE